MKNRIRKQYHFRPSPKGYFAWDVGKLIKLAEVLPTVLVEVEKIKDLHENYWYAASIPTVQSVAEHARLISECDFQFPIILSSDGRVMDGMHRVAKAWMQNERFIRAKQFISDPLPDFKDVHPDDLNYSEE
jgi:hypothetical protein